MPDTPIVVYPFEEEIEHSYPEKPFCGSEECLCHRDQDLIDEQIIGPIADGLLTPDEADRLYQGRQLC